MVWICYLFIHSSVDEHLDSFYFLAILNNALMNIHVQHFFFMYNFLCKLMFSFLLSTYLGAELLGHMVTLCLIF